MLFFWSRSRIFFLAFAGILIFNAPAYPAPPPGISDQKQTVPGLGWYTFYGNDWRAQTFTAGNFSTPETRYLVRVSLYLENNYNCPDPLVVEIRNTSGDEPGPQVLAASERNDLGEAGMYDFIFKDAIISANQKYAIVYRVKNNGGSISSNYKVNHRDNLYPGGEAYKSFDSGDNWSPVEEGKSKDFCFTTYVANLESYQDASHAAVWGTAANPYDSSNATVYIGGLGFEKNVEYHVSYYDGAGQKIATDTKRADEAGNLNSQLLLSKYPNSPPGTWHVAVYKNGDLPPEGIPVEYQPKDPYIVLKDEFVVEASAIPEFPSLLAGVVSVGLCGLMYLFWRKKALVRTTC